MFNHTVAAQPCRVSRKWCLVGWGHHHHLDHHHHHHQFDHHHLRHDDHDDAMESEEKGREGRDGVGLIGELVTLLDWRKPDYCQTYNVTTDSPPWYTPHFAMYSVNRVCAFEPSERETCSHSEILIARRNNSPSRQLSSPAWFQCQACWPAPLAGARPFIVATRAARNSVNTNQQSSWPRKSWQWELTMRVNRPGQAELTRQAFTKGWPESQTKRISGSYKCDCAHLLPVRPELSTFSPLTSCDIRPLYQTEQHMSLASGIRYPVHLKRPSNFISLQTLSVFKLYQSSNFISL